MSVDLQHVFSGTLDVAVGTQHKPLSLWTCHKSHLFNHKPNEVKDFQGTAYLVIGTVVFISKSCRSCHTHYSMVEEQMRVLPSLNNTSYLVTGPL